MRTNLSAWDWYSSTSSRTGVLKTCTVIHYADCRVRNDDKYAGQILLSDPVYAVWGTKR